jgi:hypothetical protein
MPDTALIGKIGPASSELVSERRIDGDLTEARTGSCIHPRIGLRVDRRSVAARFVEQENGEPVARRGDGRRGSRGTGSDDDEIVARVQFSRAKP